MVRPRNFPPAVVAVFFFDEKDMPGRRLQRLLERNEATGRARRRLSVFVIQPTPRLQPQGEAMKPVEGRQATDEN
jgi:hypothetical protein